MKRFFVVTALLIAAACSSDSGTVVHPGTLTLNLVTAGGNDGAMVIVVSGGPVTSVAGANDYQVASNADGRGTHIMVTGDLKAGTLATISVPDGSRAPAYVVTVEQVADRTSFGLLDPSGYQVLVGTAQ